MCVHLEYHCFNPTTCILYKKHHHHAQKHGCGLFATSSIQASQISIVKMSQVQSISWYQGTANAIQILLRSVRRHNNLISSSSLYSTQLPNRHLFDMLLFESFGSPIGMTCQLLSRHCDISRFKESPPVMPETCLNLNILRKCRAIAVGLVDIRYAL